MRYHLKSQTELDAAAEYLATLAGREATVDIKRVIKKRSLNQNSYFHLLISYWGAQNGYTIEEAKQILKEEQAELYEYRKGTRVFYRSSADLNEDDMRKSIDRYIEWAEVNGTDMPRAIDENFMDWASNYVETHGNYL